MKGIEEAEAAMDNIALYYPYIVPPDSWLKSSLLLFDRVSTIAPHADTDSTGMLDWLRSEDLWQPTYAMSLSEDDYRDEVETVLLTLAERRRYQIQPDEDLLRRHDLTNVWLGKLNESVEAALEGLQLCRRTYDGFLVHEEVANAILAITARHSAAMHDDIYSRLVTSTDLPNVMDYALTPLETRLSQEVRRSRMQRYSCRELLLEGIIPTPGPLVSVPDVVHFMRRHPEEVALFRQQLNLLVQAITVSPDPLETFRDVREGLELAIRNLRTSSRGAMWRTTGAVVVITGAVLTGAIMNAELAKFVFDGFGTAAAAGLTSRVVRGRAASNPLAYLIRAERQYGTTWR